jgi:hypothetical protein
MGALKQKPAAAHYHYWFTVRGCRVFVHSFYSTPSSRFFKRVKMPDEINQTQQPLGIVHIWEIQIGVVLNRGMNHMN